jgi:hypothetical protein
LRYENLKSLVRRPDTSSSLFGEFNFCTRCFSVLGPAAIVSIFEESFYDHSVLVSAIVDNDTGLAALDQSIEDVPINLPFLGTLSRGLHDSISRSSISAYTLLPIL